MKKFDFRNKKQLAVTFVVIFGILGTASLIRSFAAGPLASAEPESATLSGAATIGSDTTASGGKYIKFGGASSGGDVQLPARTVFYYPWFPETWYADDAFHPTLGNYDSGDQTVIDKHIDALDYDKFEVAVASWWGQTTHKENIRIPLLLSRTQAKASPLKWALYYEKEGSGNPTVAELQNDLNYIKANYASSPSYARVGGKPVIFVYSADDTTCEVADRWAQANAGIGFYVNLKLFGGYTGCTNQPSSWHQYAGAPPGGEDHHLPYSFNISPGFQLHGTSATLTRDETRFTGNVQHMAASGAAWQLVVSFNEWGEGSNVESATEWPLGASGYGPYQDILHNN